MSFYDHFSAQEVAVLRARAERIADAQDNAQEGEAISALAITIGSERYALPMEMLTAVHEDCSVVIVPGAPSFVAGIASIRGQILPVLDLAALLGVPGEPEKRALLVASNLERSVALCAAAIGDAINILSGTLQPVPTTLNGVYLQGVLPDGMALLNVDAILTHAALIVDQTVG